MLSNNSTAMLKLLHKHETRFEARSNFYWLLYMTHGLGIAHGHKLQQAAAGLLFLGLRCRLSGQKSDTHQHPKSTHAIVKPFTSAERAQPELLDPLKRPQHESREAPRSTTAVHVLRIVLNGVDRHVFQKIYIAQAGCALVKRTLTLR